MIGVWARTLGGGGALCEVASALVLLVPLVLKSAADDDLLALVLARSQAPSPFPAAENPKTDAKGHLISPLALRQQAEAGWLKHFADQRRRDRWAASLALAGAALVLVSMGL